MSLPANQVRQTAKSQSGYIAVLFAAILALGLTLSIGTIVAQLKKSGALNRSLAAGDNSTQQHELLAGQRLLLAWYQNNAYALDNISAQPDLTAILSTADVQRHGASAAMSNLLNSNGVGYHVFALWYPIPGAQGTGLDVNSGIFSVGTVNGVPANTPYILASGFAIESLYVQQTRTNMYRIADLLVNYFDDQNANDADASVDTNWFRDVNCATDAVALPCYGADSTNSTAMPINQTVLQPVSQTSTAPSIPSMIGLSATDMVTAWNNSGSVITVNNYPISTLPAPPPPYTVTLNTVLPWGDPSCPSAADCLTVVAVSN